MVHGEQLKRCVGKIRKVTTVRLWAEKRGFNYQTVIKVLHGYTGKRQIGVAADIVNALREDGYLDPVANRKAAA